MAFDTLPHSHSHSGQHQGSKCLLSPFPQSSNFLAGKATLKVTFPMGKAKEMWGKATNQGRKPEPASLSFYFFLKHSL